MNTRAENTAGQPLSTETSQPFRMFAVFDTEEASKAALEAADLVLHELGAEIDAEKTFCDAALLNSPVSFHHAVSSAADADIIIVALAGTGAPPRLKQWAEQWLHLRKLSGGLMAIIPVTGDHEDISDLVQFFRETAISANMDFLCRKQRARTAH